jgi:hypothetical protein
MTADASIIEVVKIIMGGLIVMFMIWAFCR